MFKLNYFVFSFVAYICTSTPISNNIIHLLSFSRVQVVSLWLSLQKRKEVTGQSALTGS